MFDYSIPIELLEQMLNRNCVLFLGTQWDTGGQYGGSYQYLLTELLKYCKMGTDPACGVDTDAELGCWPEAASTTRNSTSKAKVDVNQNLIGTFCRQAYRILPLTPAMSNKNCLHPDLAPWLL